MVFKPTDFNGWVEQDVREDVIAKLLERLGYEKGTANDILRGGQLKPEYDREEIGKVQIWQAYSYAKHHEVRAVMYCVCNGRELHIFRTDFMPEAALVRAFRYEEFDAEFDTIRNILARTPSERLGRRSR